MKQKRELPIRPLCLVKILKNVFSILLVLVLLILFGGESLSLISGWNYTQQCLDI